MNENVKELDEALNSSREAVNNYDNYFTETSNGLDIEANNINANCITSRNEKFNLDSDGNLTVNSINFSSSENNILSFEAILNKVYPVGAIYISTNDVNPGTLFTGTWEKIENRFLVASGSSYANGSTGGAATHTHTSAAHTHGYGSLYAAAHFAGTSGFLYRTKTGVSYTPNEKKADTGAGSTYTTKRTEGIQVYGTTGSTTPGNTGSASSLPPYLAVSVWKRVS